MLRKAFIWAQPFFNNFSEQADSLGPKMPVTFFDSSHFAK